MGCMAALNECLTGCVHPWCASYFTRRMLICKSLFSFWNDRPNCLNGKLRSQIFTEGKVLCIMSIKMEFRSLPYFFTAESTMTQSKLFILQIMSDEWVLWLNGAEISPIQPRPAEWGWIISSLQPFSPIHPHSSTHSAPFIPIQLNC